MKNFEIIVVIFYLIVSFVGKSTVNGQKLVFPYQSAKKLSKNPPKKSLITPHINGGVTAEQFPFMVAIVQVDNGEATIVCGASIIGPKNLLTAAHCLDHLSEVMKDGVKVEAWIAPKDLDHFSGQKIGLKQFKKFPFYGGADTNLTHDIGLVELSSDIVMSDKVSPICIGTGKYDGEPVVIIGFGKYDCQNPSRILLKAAGRVIGKAQCEEMGHPQNMVDSQLCGKIFSWEGGASDGGNGDSGGPLFQRSNGQFIQVGIVSYGYEDPQTNCPDSKIPGTYTRVGSYVPFIQLYAPEAKFC